MSGGWQQHVVGATLHCQRAFACLPVSQWMLPTPCSLPTATPLVLHCSALRCTSAEMKDLEEEELSGVDMLELRRRVFDVSHGRRQQ